MKNVENLGVLSYAAHLYNLQNPDALPEGQKRLLNVMVARIHDPQYNISCYTASKGRRLLDLDTDTFNALIVKQFYKKGLPLPEDLWSKLPELRKDVAEMAKFNGGLLDAQRRLLSNIVARLINPQHTISHLTASQGRKLIDFDTDVLETFIEEKAFKDKKILPKRWQEKLPALIDEIDKNARSRPKRKSSVLEDNLCHGSDKKSRGVGKQTSYEDLVANRKELAR